MRALIVAAGCLIAGMAAADEAVVKVYSLSVQERLETLELIDVTAEKAPAQTDAPMDAELAEILSEVEALEQASGLVTD
ncbi:MAG: hypothetical protein GWM88_00515 [Pseudomonadales bacterium]|nr:hypothetical protein [Pseudomonadales bacterium]NIX06581.1 hypothetical protein [Pseudomonadales bacterium]